MKTLLTALTMLGSSSLLYAAGANVDINAETNSSGGSVVSVPANLAIKVSSFSIETKGNAETITTVGTIYATGGSLRGSFKSNARADSLVNVGTEAHIGSLVVK